MRKETAYAAPSLLKESDNNMSLIAALPNFVLRTEDNPDEEK